MRRSSTIYSAYVKPLSTEDLAHILAHTLPLWNQARGKRIFLTGGTGFFGKWLLESFAYCNRELDLNISATVLCRDPGGFLQKMPHLAVETSIRWLPGDIRSFSFPDDNFEFVIHAAAPTSADAAQQPLELLSILMDGTSRMLTFANARNTRKFLFVSSGAVYGKQPENLYHVPEDYRGGPDWLDPNAAYAEGKRVSEQMCSISARQTNIDFTIARCFAFVGPHLPLNQHFAIGNFIADALASRNIAIRGDGTPTRSYLYAADLAIWLWTLLFKDLEIETKPRVFNVGSGEAVSIRELARQVVEELNPSLKVEIAKEPVAGAPLLQYVPDVNKAADSFNLRTTIPLREAIRRTAEWYRSPNLF